MDDEIMTTIDKWYHPQMGMFKRVKTTLNHLILRPFDTESERDLFIKAFVFEKTTRLEEKQEIAQTEIDSLKQDVFEWKKKKQEITQITFTEIDALKHDIECMKSQLTKLSDENKQLRINVDPVKIDTDFQDTRRTSFKCLGRFQCLQATR